MLDSKAKSNRPRELRIQLTCNDCRMHGERFFCELAEPELRLFELIKFTRAYPKGAILFVEGQPSNGVYMLCQGRIKLSTCSPDGKVIILGIVEAGDILGLSAIVSDVEYEATAEALEISQVNYVRKREFLAYLQQNPKACLRAVRQLGRSYHAAHKLICSLGQGDSVSVKLAKLFLGWSENGHPVTGTLLLKNSFTHEEIAEMIGTTRETVTRALRDMRERGLVTLKGSNLTIHDAERLRLAVGPRIGQ